MSGPEPGEHDPKALRALAHPLRWRLIDVVWRERSATATRCAELLGESAASCSYHLNILAKYGFVERAAGGVGRERPWQLTSPRQELAPEGLGVEGTAAARAAVEVFLEHEFQRLRQRMHQESQLGEVWRRAVLTGGVTTLLTAAEFAEVTGMLREILLRYTDRTEHPETAPEGAREVRIFVAATVTPEPDPVEPDSPTPPAPA